MMTEEREKELREARREIGLYSVQELRVMFNCGRTVIDNALNTGQLKYLSPNNRERFVYLNDFIEFMKKGGEK